MGADIQVALCLHSSVDVAGMGVFPCTSSFKCTPFLCFPEMFAHQP